MTIGTGHGITIEGATSGFLARIRGADFEGRSRKSIDTTHAGSGEDATFIPGDFIDNGSMRVSMLYDPAVEPPFDDVEEWTVTYPDGTTKVFDGFLTDQSDAAPYDDLMTQEVTIKISGAIVTTPGA